MTQETAALLLAGTSGLVLPAPNKQAFPEAFRAGSRLAYYSTLFNSIEINSTFYKMPLPKTFSRWAAEVQPDFRFTIKLWRGITHVPGLRFTKEDVYRCLYAVHHLGEKKGALLIQLPPGLQVSAAEKLEQLLDLRFHGPAGDYKGGYSDAGLRTWAEKAVAWLSAGKEVFIYFNNTIGDALPNLIRLRTLIPDDYLSTSNSLAAAATQ